MFPFFRHPEYSTCSNILKKGSIHFQHVNTDHIITMSFIRIEFRNDLFNIILREFKICQVLISNGNS